MDKIWYHAHVHKTSSQSRLITSPRVYDLDLYRSVEGLCPVTSADYTVSVGG